MNQTIHKQKFSKKFININLERKLKPHNQPIEVVE